MEKHNYDYPKAMVIITEMKQEEIDIEDGGQALIFTATQDDEEDIDGMFVRVQSWDETKKHKEMSQFIGKKIKITVEVI